MGTTMHHDLLTEPLLTVEGPSGRERLTLPAVLARLAGGDELEFPALRPHQQHAWHAFLVQSAALIAHRRGEPIPALDAAGWSSALLDLAGDAGAAAWYLVVDELSLPAFFQTPVPEGDLGLYKKRIPTPDELDVVVTTRNHDMKQQRMVSPEPEHWAYALLTLQTMEGFLGRGNYGIARMNGGFSNRPRLGMVPGLGWAERFQRDVQAWLDARPELVSEIYGYPERGGQALLWLLPWDGKKSSKRPLSVCDPFFIEVCRRVRLVGPAPGEARMGATEDYLLDAGDAAGDTGDVWTPVSTAGTALTVGGSGFNYRLLTRLLFSGDFRRNPALELREEDGREPLLLAQTLVRGQGQTEGYHQRVIRLPAPVRGLLGSREGRDLLGARAQSQVELASKAGRKVLHAALCALLQKGADKLDFQDDRTGPWLQALDQAVDDAFFEHLWAAAEVPEDEADRRWQTRLLELARQQLEHALASAPTSAADAPRAKARAELMFRGLAHKHLPAAFDTKPAENPEERAIHAG